MKHLYLLLFFCLSLISLQSYSQPPGKTISTAVAMNVPDTMWEYCSYTNQGMIHQGWFNLDSTYFVDTSNTDRRIAWYKFTVPTGKGIHACVIDFPASVMCTTYVSFSAGVAVLKDTSRSQYLGGGSSYCYNSGMGSGIDALWYRPAYIDSLQEGKTYYLEVVATKLKPVSTDIGIKWLPYLFHQYDCSASDTVYNSPYRGCNLTDVGQYQFQPQWQTPRNLSNNLCPANVFPFDVYAFNPVYYTIIPTADTFTINLHSVNPQQGIGLMMYVFKDCSHLGDYSIDSTTGNYKYYYACGDTTIHISNATPGIPLTLAIDAGVYCGDLVFCPAWDIFNITGSGIILPLKLISFTAHYNSIHNNVILNWQTEANDAEFTIEKSTNGTTFNPIGKVKGIPQTTSHQYSFTDQSIAKGKTYYRLKSTTKDGKSSYSKMAIIELKNEKLSVVSPNPTHNQINISYTASFKEKLTLILMNLQGEKVYSKTAEAKAGNNLFHLSPLFLPKGIYFLKISSVSNEDIIRIVVE